MVNIGGVLILIDYFDIWAPNRSRQGADIPTILFEPMLDIVAIYLL